MIFTNQKVKQVRFALSSSPVFSRIDMETDSAHFYNSMLEFLDDPDEQKEVDQLLKFWNRYVVLLSINKMEMADQRTDWFFQVIPPQRPP